MAQEQQIVDLIESHLSQMTDLEQRIAQFFIQDAQVTDDLSAQTLAHKLHISKAALTRFAKKCGFAGYREFVFRYLNQAQEESRSQPIPYNQLTQQVLKDYDIVSQRSQDLIDEEQLLRVAQMIDAAERVYFFGKGSSGLVAREMKLRFMRLGVICEALTEQDSFTWTTSILDERCLVIGFSLSGQTVSVIDSLHKAHLKGAQTVLLTTGLPDLAQNFSEVITVATLNHLHYGQRISPQIPLLMVIDLLYAYFFDIDRPRKESIFDSYWENRVFGQDR